MTIRLRLIVLLAICVFAGSGRPGGDAVAQSQSLENCLEIKKTQGTSAYLACIARGTGSSKDAPQTAACERDVKDGVDWVFRDAGAHTTYNRFRSQGFSAYEAVYGAQGHNPPFQAQLEACKGWVIAYLATLGRNTDGADLTDETLTAAACSCVSINPAGAQYSVSNSCAATMRISVTFIDAAGGAQPVTRDAGIVLGGGTALIPAPNLTLNSIASTTLAGTRNAVTCRY